MARIDHNKRNRLAKIDHYAEAVERNALQRIKPKAKNFKRIFVDLGEHEHHDYTIERGPFGNHAGRIRCCGKVIRWLPKSVFR